MEFDIKRLFETDKGKSLYADFLRIVKEYNMGEKIRDGVLIGFSGGADSVMLACALYKFTQDNNFRPPVAVHINHMIRGEEADRDENFSRNFCKCLGIEFLSFSFDVPKEAKKYSLGLEEAAREVRYSAFNDLLNRRQDLSSIAVAHNATDNLETVIFHMMRGTGTRGMAGISPVRDNIIRPLLYVPKRDIVSALEVSSVPYVIDSTNSEIDYKRNYIRAEMLPKLFFLAENPEAQITKLTKNLRADDLYIESVARSFVDKFSDNIIPKKELLELNSAVLYRVIGIIAKSGLSLGIENVHASKIHELIHSGKDNFSVNLPGGVSFICKGGVCYVGEPECKSVISYEKRLSIGINVINEISAEIILSVKPIEYSSKVYKIAIQDTIDFDIIKGELRAREKRDGDSYVYGGLRRKLKKIFNDKSIPPEKRSFIPVLCDDEGIVWVPGFKARDGGRKNSQNKLYVAVAYKT